MRNEAENIHPEGELSEQDMTAVSGGAVSDVYRKRACPECGRTQLGSEHTLCSYCSLEGKKVYLV